MLTNGCGNSIDYSLYNTAMAYLGSSSRKHKDWFDESCTEINQLLEDKRHTYKVHTDNPNSTAKKTQWEAYAAPSSRSCVRCRAAGLATKLMKFRALQTGTA